MPERLLVENSVLLSCLAGLQHTQAVKQALAGADGSPAFL